MSKRDKDFVEGGSLLDPSAQGAVIRPQLSGPVGRKVAGNTAQDDGFNVLPRAIYPEATQIFGAKNVEEALIFVKRISDPITGLAICLGSDDESITDIIAAAFASDKREVLNSESWGEKLSDAIETVRYSMQLTLVLIPDGSLRVVNDVGDITFEGGEWSFVQWVRQVETELLNPDVPDLRDPCDNERELSAEDAGGEQG